MPHDVAAVDPEVSLLVVDYILNKGEEADYLQRSREFVRGYVARVEDSAVGCPYVVLMSGLPKEAEKQAPGFREDVGIPGAYFRFSEKQPAGLSGFEPALEAFARQRDELEAYRRMHERLSKVAAAASEEVKSRLNALELQDLATLHAGQLIQEGEALTDYLAWLYGQVFTAHVVKDAVLAARSAELPIDTHNVLLGHLPPTQHIFQMFSAFSLVKSGSTLLYKKKQGFLPLRFGDLFAIPLKHKKSVAAAFEQPVKYFMVMSQTCDLLQGKIKNDQVLCAQGDGKKVNNTEVDLLRATMKQMNNSGSILLKSGGDYIQIDWNAKDVRTFNTDILTHERNATYLGRLNELYALEVQHNVLNELGRVGVPIQPGYSTVFRKVILKVLSGKDTEVPELASSFDQGMIVGVLRNQKDDKRRHQLLIADEVRKWLVSRIVALADHALLPPPIKLDVIKFRNYLTANPDWRFMAREDGGQTKLTRQLADGKSESFENKVALVFVGIFDPSNLTDARLEISFHPAADFPAAERIE